MQPMVDHGTDHGTQHEEKIQPAIMEECVRMDGSPSYISQFHLGGRDLCGFKLQKNRHF